MKMDAIIMEFEVELQHCNSNTPTLAKGEFLEQTLTKQGRALLPTSAALTLLVLHTILRLAKPIKTLKNARARISLKCGIRARNVS